jgi:hypothetical protein
MNITDGWNPQHVNPVRHVQLDLLGYSILNIPAFAWKFKNYFQTFLSFNLYLSLPLFISRSFLILSSLLFSCSPLLIFSSFPLHHLFFLSFYINYFLFHFILHLPLSSFLLFFLLSYISFFVSLLKYHCLLFISANRIDVMKRRRGAGL